MSAHIMTAFGSKTGGAGSRTISATFRGPSLVAPETGYDAGTGSVLDLTTKPAAAAPAADAASTSEMLYSVVRTVKATPATAALDNQFRLRYARAAAGAPGTGTVKVYGPAAVVTEFPFDFLDITDPALTSVVLVLATGPGTRVIGAEIEIVTPFASPAGTLTLDIGIAGGDLDGFVDCGDVIGVAAGTIDNTPGVLSVAGMYQYAAAGNIGLHSTSTVGNLDALTAGEAIARIWTIDNDAFGDPATWGEVANGTDLSGVTFTVEAEGL
jgi:hypothetical protein